MTVDTNAPERIWASFNSGGSIALSRLDKKEAEQDTWRSMSGPHEFIRLDLHEAAVRKAREVKVRALVWHDRLKLSDREGFVCSVGGVTSYAIMLSRFRVYGVAGDHDGAAEFTTLETAKAAAQADYERRIREALE